MAVTEQQFIEAYKWMDANQQQKTYNAGDQQVKQWIDNYNASINNQNNYTPQDTWKNLGNWNYWADTADRQEEIVNNLNQAYTQDPTKFSDWQTFSDNFNYNYSGRSDKERETMRNWYENKMWTGMDYNNVNNTDYFLNQLMQWNTLQWTWAAITAAQNRYKNYQTLSWMTPDQIASAVASWAINGVGQDMQDLKNYSPALYAQVQAAIQNKTQVDDINSIWDWIYNWLTSTETNDKYKNYDMTGDYTKNASIIKQYNESLYKQITNLWGDTAAYVAIVASMLQNPVIQANKDEVENLEWEINKIQEQMYTIWDTVREKLWSEAPEDLVSAYISHQTKQLQNQLRTTQNSLLVAQWKLNNQLQEVETLLDALSMWWWTSWWSSDYQFVSGTKYQQAWYFNKKTWEFIPLSWSTWSSWSWWWSWTGWWTSVWWIQTVDKNDYQDDSPERLKQIQSNLEKISKSNPEYFKDRATFNEYFKYSQRSAKQKAVLDAFWVNNKWLISTWTRITWTSWWTETDSWDGISNDFVSTVKKDLLSWKIISLSASDMKKQYPQYWKIWWSDSASASLASKIWYNSTLEEIEKISTWLSDSLTDNLYKWYWSNSKNITKSANEIKKMWDWNTKSERQQMTVYLNWLWINQTKWEKILKEAWVKDKYITIILSWSDAK